jgi:type II secretory pathway pseudopilin PulG
MRSKFRGFTTIELLTVIAVIAILLGLLLPSLNMARNTARNAQQRVQLAAIDQALLAFRNDYGDYPPSEYTWTTEGGYGGAQKLVEGLLGLDLLGFHPDSEFDAILLENPLYTELTLHERRPRYLEIETASPFLVGNYQSRAGLFGANTGYLAPFTYVLCDVYGRIPVEVGGRIERAGLPILYYRANPSGIGLDLSGRPVDTIYDFADNSELVGLGDNSWDDLKWGEVQGIKIKPFYEFITDDRVVRSEGARPWPYRPDSYILISAGIDGLYGTRDDITNFGY